MIGHLAGTLRGQVDAWEIWNEEDTKDFWAGGPQPARYVALLKPAYAAVADVPGLNAFGLVTSGGGYEPSAQARAFVHDQQAKLVTQYGNIVRARSGQAFIAACEAALGESANERQRNILAMREVVDATSWDQTARHMGELIEALRTRPTTACLVSA